MNSISFEIPRKSDKSLIALVKELTGTKSIG
jgi:hypothetical protein